MATDLPVGVKLTGEELLHLQQRSARHVGFSITEACPLRCRHCIVDTFDMRDRQRVSVSPGQAQAWSAQLTDLVRAGVTHISITGGEPLSAAEALKILTDSASAAGLGCTVVTACQWARTPEQADRTLKRYPGVTDWHLSADRFHQEFLPVEYVLNAAQAVARAGRRAMIRMAVSRPPTTEDRRLYQELTTRLPDGIPVAVQPLSLVGRASDLSQEVPAAPERWAPCVSTGMTVRYDGSVSPCCSSLIGQRTGHPFHYPNAHDVGLVEAYRAWRQDPLLSLVRSVGFGPLLGWAREADTDPTRLPAASAHPCDVCTALWNIPGMAQTARSRSGTSQAREKIMALEHAVFGRPASP